MRRQVDVGAPACLSFPGGLSHERLPEPLPAMKLMHPNLAQFADASPGVAGDCPDELALGFGEEPQQGRVFIPGAARVGLVKAILQAIDLFGRQVVSRFDLDASQIHASRLRLVKHSRAYAGRPASGNPNTGAGTGRGPRPR